MNHEKTIKRIQELVPSVMALEFGCRIKHKKRGYGTLIDSTHLVFENEKESIYAPFIDGNGTILGTPITLAVVLMAIAKVNTREKENYCVTPDGGICFIGYAGRFYHQVSNWNLSKDNFNDQSEETKSFIKGLLN